MTNATFSETFTAQMYAWLRDASTPHTLRGIGCGAIGEEEALATGPTLEELKSKSFAGILRTRRSRNLSQ